MAPGGAGGGDSAEPYAPRAWPTVSFTEAGTEALGTPRVPEGKPREEAASERLAPSGHTPPIPAQPERLLVSLNYLTVA